MRRCVISFSRFVDICAAREEFTNDFFCRFMRHCRAKIMGRVNGLLRLYAKYLYVTMKL